MPRGYYRPDWQQALIALSATVVSALVVLALYQARTIFIPLALAAFLTFVLAPPVRLLQKRGLPRIPAVLVVVGLAVCVTGSVLWFVGQQVASLTASLPDNVERIKTKIEVVKGWVSGPADARLANMIGELQDSIFPPPKQPGGPPEPRTVVVERSRDSWMTRLESFVSPAAEAFGQFAFTFVLVIFMLLKTQDLRSRVIKLVSAGRVTTATKAVDDASRRISRYLLVQLCINSGFGLALTLGFVLLGVKYAALWGFFGAVMRYIPYLGSWIGMVPPAVFALALGDSVWHPVAVILFYATLELICANALEPWLFGTSLGMSEVAQLVAAAFWLFLWGPIGVILSGPMTACLLVMGKYAPQLQFFEVLLGHEPPLTPPVALYQRLTARDQDEASRILHEAATGHDLVEVFDAVVVPALALSRSAAEEGELDGDDQRYILATAREVIDEIGDIAGSGTKSPGQSANRVRVCLVPARDEADRVALEMLAAVLDPDRWEVDVATVEMLSSELIERVEELGPAVVCVGSLPPGGLAHTRYLCKRLRHRFPDLRLVVGRWTEQDGADAARTELTAAGAHEVYRTLAEAKRQLGAWSPVFRNHTGGEPGGDSARSGPVSASASVGTTRA
jgi:predicted PurR-regulated permease PerM